MAGTAKTSRFNIGSGTLMLGPQSALFDLNPATHSLGLVKNLQVTSDPQFVDLTQGSKNTVVWSMLTASPVRLSAEVYEYTAKNMAYGLSLDGSSLANQTQSTTLTSGINGTVVPVTVLPVASAAGLANNDVVMLQEPDSDDNFLVRKITNIAGLNVTIDPNIKAEFPTGSIVRKVNTVDVGSQADNPYFAAAIAGKLADGTPVLARFPKVRVTKGFTFAFNSEQYGNLPYEIEVMDLLPSDTFYADFKTKKAQLFTP